MEYKQASPKSGHIRVWHAAWLKKIRRIRVMKKKNKEVVVEKDVQVVAEEELEEVNLGSDPQELRLISISSSLMEKEKRELMLNVFRPL